MSDIQSKDEELREKVNQLVLETHNAQADYWVSMATDDILKLFKAYGYSERLDEIKETVESSNRYGRDFAYSDYPFYVVEMPDVETRKVELQSAIKEIV